MLESRGAICLCDSGLNLRYSQWPDSVWGLGRASAGLPGAPGGLVWTHKVRHKLVDLLLLFGSIGRVLNGCGRHG